MMPTIPSPTRREDASTMPHERISSVLEAHSHQVVDFKEDSGMQVMRRVIFPKQTRRFHGQDREQHQEGSRGARLDSEGRQNRKTTRIGFRASNSDRYLKR